MGVFLCGFKDGSLNLEKGGQLINLGLMELKDSDQPHLIEAPTLDFDDSKIILNPYVFQHSRIQSRDRENTLHTGLDGHATFLPLLVQSFEVMQRFAPREFNQITTFAAYIGLNDPEYADRSQTSLSDMPGTFIVLQPT